FFFHLFTVGVVSSTFVLGNRVELVANIASQSQGAGVHIVASLAKFGGGAICWRVHCLFNAENRNADRFKNQSALYFLVAVWPELDVSLFPTGAVGAEYDGDFRRADVSCTMQHPIDCAAVSVPQWFVSSHWIEKHAIVCNVQQFAHRRGTVESLD